MLVGSRLADELDQMAPDAAPQMTISAVSSLEAVESATMQIATAFELLGPAVDLRLSILLVGSTGADGRSPRGTRRRRIARP